MTTVFKAEVRDGRLVLDEPTELPEGEVVYLRPVDAAAVSDGELSQEEREDLFDALDAAIESVRPPEDTAEDDLEASESGDPEPKASEG